MGTASGGPLTASLLDLTGDDADVRAPSGARWFVLSSGDADGQGALVDDGHRISYSAFAQQYLNVVIDENAIGTFEAAVDQTATAVAGLASGTRGTLDASSLARLHDIAANLEQFLTARGSQFRGLADSMRSGKDFQGSAAALLAADIDHEAAELKDSLDRFHASGAPLSTVIGDAVDALASLRSSIADAWSTAAAGGLRESVRTAVGTQVQAIVMHLTSQGVVAGTASYQLESMKPTTHDVSAQAQAAYQQAADQKIQTAFATFPVGDLRQQSTWDALSRAVSATVTPFLDALDQTAAHALAQLEAAYVRLIDALTPWGGAPASAPAPAAGAGTSTGGSGPAPGGDPAPGGNGGAGPAAAGAPVALPAGTEGGAAAESSSAFPIAANTIGSQPVADNGANVGGGEPPAGAFAAGAGLSLGAAPASGAAAPAATANGPGRQLAGAAPTETPVGAVQPEPSSTSTRTPAVRADAAPARRGGGVPGVRLGGRRKSGGGQRGDGQSEGDAQSGGGSAGRPSDVLGVDPERVYGDAHQSDGETIGSFLPTSTSVGTAAAPPEPPTHRPPSATPTLSASMSGPMYPPAFGGGGARRRSSGTRRTWLIEDEDVWGAAALAGDGVVGRDAQVVVPLSVTYSGDGLEPGVQGGVVGGPAAELVADISERA